MSISGSTFRTNMERSFRLRASFLSKYLQPPFSVEISRSLWPTSLRHLKTIKQDSTLTWRVIKFQSIQEYTGTCTGNVFTQIVQNLSKLDVWKHLYPRGTVRFGDSIRYGYLLEVSPISNPESAPLSKHPTSIFWTIFTVMAATLYFQ